MSKYNQLFILTGILLVCLESSWAAKPIDLKHQPVSLLHTVVSFGINLQEISRNDDFNQITHVRFQQFYQGYPVWGSDAVLHVPQQDKKPFGYFVSAMSEKGKMNGVIYQDLSYDLAGTPAYVLGKAEATHMLQETIQYCQKRLGINQKMEVEKQQLMVYVDHNNQAHWAYLIGLSVSPLNKALVRPTYIIDATHFHVYQQWNNTQTLNIASSGGFGGNQKMGKRAYDGLIHNFPPLVTQRDEGKRICYLRNKNVTVKNFHQLQSAMYFSCEKINKKHNNIYWNAELDPINGAYSPSNDALFTGQMIKKMYQSWYGVPVLVKSGKPMILNMVVHANMENAYWDGRQMVFGDGGKVFYPLVSLGVGAHEISHGFTEQHSGLAYFGESGGLNESFSDMAAQAAEFYALGHNHWQIGSEILKQKDQALRYMDIPSKDCKNAKSEGACSIDHVAQYYDGLDVHFSSGIFNRIFYLLSTAKKWNTRKAFNVMVHANQYYWTSMTSFTDAACGVLQSAKDFQYDTQVVVNAMKTVGIDVTGC